MKIINTSETFRIIDLMNQYDDLYFKDLNICAHPYRSSLVIIDLTNGMKTGKTCTRWLFSVSPWKMDADRLCLTEYVEMAAPECDTLCELVAWLRAEKPLHGVDGLTFETGAQPSNRTFSPFSAVKPVKLGERLNASTVAKAIRAAQAAPMAAIRTITPPMPLMTSTVGTLICRLSRRTSSSTRAAGVSGGATKAEPRSPPPVIPSIIKPLLWRSDLP